MSDFADLLETALQKPKRKRDRKLLDRVKQRPCVVCGHRGSEFNPIDPSHIKTVKSGGPDESFNLVSHCRTHHHEWGQDGPSKYFEKHPDFWHLLQIKGWYLDEFGKLRHPDLEKGE